MNDQIPTFYTYKEAREFFNHCQKWVKKREGILFNISLIKPEAWNRKNIICRGCNSPIASSTARRGWCKECTKNGLGRQFQASNAKNIYKGEGNPNYVNGNAKQTFRQKGVYKVWMQNVKKRDKQCMICGRTKELHAHHILPNALLPHLSLEILNGITLCRFHHIALHEKMLDIVLLPELYQSKNLIIDFINHPKIQELKFLPYKNYESYALIKCLPKNYLKMLQKIHPDFQFPV